MKSIVIVGLLITLAVRGCQDENEYLITKAGDTIYKEDVATNWTRFKHDADSIMYEADFKIATAVRTLKKNNTQSKVALMGNILRAEQLIERLGEKQERAKQFDEMVNLDEKEFLKMEAYKKEYKNLEAKLNRAIAKIHSDTIIKKQ